MSTITSVKLWYDTGYTEGSSEIPPVGHTLGTPDIVLTGPFAPAKGRIFNELQVKESYTDLMNCSYLEVELELNNGLPSKTFYGWIDDISISSDNTNYPMTVIKWHVDLWRTFNQGAEYGSGTIIRRPSTSADLYQNYPYRFKSLNATTVTLNTHDVGSTAVFWWVLLAYQAKTSGGQVSELRWLTFPLTTPSVGVEDWYIKDPDNHVGHALRFDAVLGARVDDYLGINPDTITGAWLSPVCPIGEGMDGAGTDSDPFRLTFTGTWKGVTHDHDSVKYGWFQTEMQTTTSIRDIFHHSAKTFTPAIQSTEGHEKIVTGPMGEQIGVIPFGKSSARVDLNLIVSSIAASIRLEFGPASEGMVFEYPLPTIDINGNSWSEYVYSGQRDYDIATRNANSEKSAVEGGISGAMSGALMGGLVGQGGFTGGNMAIGAAIGAVGPIASGILDATVYNSRFQDIEDNYHARQADTTKLAGCGSFLYYNRPLAYIELCTLEYDNEALTNIESIKEVQGVKSGIPASDCTSLITTGGPLQISNLIVKGDIPVAAKKWIKQKFADGVRIVSR